MLTTSIGLLERLRQLDHQADWARFVSVYSPMLFALAGRLVIPAAQREDFVQDVLVRTVQAMPSFQHDGQHRFRAWLKTVALNVWRGRRKRLASQPFDSLMPPAVEPELDRFIEEESLRHLAERALAVMRTDFQPAIWQACWETVVEGRSGQEVADKLGLSVAAVYSARSRVLRRLREELGDFLS